MAPKKPQPAKGKSQTNNAKAEPQPSKPPTPPQSVSQMNKQVNAAVLAGNTKKTQTLLNQLNRIDTKNVGKLGKDKNINTQVSLATNRIKLQSALAKDALNKAYQSVGNKNLDAAEAYAKAAQNRAAQIAKIKTPGKPGSSIRGNVNFTRQNAAGYINASVNNLTEQIAKLKNPEEPENPDPGPGPGTDTKPSPLSVAELYSTPAPRPTLIPGRDVVELAAPQVSAESMEQLLFQQLSSFEIVNLARRDTIEGLNPYYSVISNLSSIREEYNPSQIISLQKPAQGLSDLYQIKLSDKIPDDAYLTRNNITNFFYIDNNGDFIIELDNMLVDEVIEIQIATSGKIT